MAMVILQLQNICYIYADNIVTVQVANSNHTELSALCQGWLRGQGGQGSQGGPSEALMIAIQVT